MRYETGLWSIGFWLLRAARSAPLLAALLAVVLAGCSGSDSGGTADTPPAAAPVIGTPPQPASVSDGQAATFTVAASGDGLRYQWQKNGADVSGANTASLTITTAAVADSGSRYRVVVSNAGGSITSGEATLTVTPVAPTITSQPAAASVVEGAAATFSVSATGSAPLAYQWQRNGLDITGATAASYALSPTVLGDSGATFSVRVSNAAGPANSAAARLTVVAAPVAPSISTQPIGVTVIAGQTASFSVVAGGSPSISYQWQRNGVDISSATGVSYTTPVTALADGGAQFRVVVSNGVTSITSAAATLTVQAAPDPFPAVLACGDQSGHTLALKKDGTVWAWGRNETGQLGDGTLNNRTAAAQVAGLSNIASVAAGVSHSLFLASDGRVFGVGSDMGGELGAGSASALGFRGTPTLTTVIGSASSISAGKGPSVLNPGASVAVTSTGGVRGWGQTPDLTTPGNSGGAAGRDYPGFPAAASVDADSRGSVLVVGQDGSLWFIGTDLRTLGASVTTPVYAATRMPGIDSLRSVAMGSFHVLALKRDGTVWSWGSGSLGYAVPSGVSVNTPTQVPGLSSIVRVAASQTMSMALRDDGTVFVWGRNVEGQLGLGTASANSSTVVPPTAVPGLGRVRDICAGWLHAVFALEDGTVWAAGDNRYGQLGNTTVPFLSYAPVPVTGLTLPR
jgi:alpha-tubulin suppressor-like RCC1 family protein